MSLGEFSMPFPLLKLVSAEQITNACALGIAERIGALNPEITAKILAEFKDKLRSRKTQVLLSVVPSRKSFVHSGIIPTTSRSLFRMSQALAVRSTVMNRIICPCSSSASL